MQEQSNNQRQLVAVRMAINTRHLALVLFLAVGGMTIAPVQSQGVWSPPVWNSDARDYVCENKYLGDWEKLLWIKDCKGSKWTCNLACEWDKFNYWSVGGCETNPETHKTGCRCWGDCFT